MADNVAVIFGISGISGRALADRLHTAGGWHIVGVSRHRPADIGVLVSAVAAFFYVRVIVLMYFSEPAADGPTVAVPSFLTQAAVTAGVVVAILLGVLPQPLLDLADRASVFIR